MVNLVLLSLNWNKVTYSSVQLKCDVNGWGLTSYTETGTDRLDLKKPRTHRRERSTEAVIRVCR